MRGVAQNRRVLIIFARAPRVGTVKSRLAKDIGPVAAWRLYRGWLDGLVRELARDERWTTRLAVTPDANKNAGAFQLGQAKGVEVINQGSGDLGDRMRRQFQRALPNPTVIIGTDLPDIKREDIWCAFRALRKSDAVFGPSVDGGYWLIGLNGRRQHPNLFDSVRWSTETTLRDTITTLTNAEVSYLDERRDIDTVEDLKHRARAC